MTTWSDLLSREIVVVSGKGGTGKSTVAAALALAAAARGRSVLLAEVERRAEIEGTLGVPDPGYEEAPVGPGLWALSITPDDALREYLKLYVGLDPVTRRVLKVYDLVVIDGPPTGQIVSFVTAPSAFADLVRLGRVGRQSAGIDRLLREHAAVVLVSLPEEMSVAETIEAAPAVKATGVPAGAVVANRRRPDVVPRGTPAAFERMDGEALAAFAASASLPLDVAGTERILEAARVEATRVARERRLVRALRSVGPVLELSDLVRAVEGSRLLPAERLAAVIAGPDAPVISVRRSPPPVRRDRHTGAGGRRRHANLAPDLKETLERARIVVVCGSGGVGKTTISAAIAVALADRGRETALLTVDPARRLATALRLPELAGERAVVRLGQGRSIEAMQLDTQRTFDGLVERYAGSDERRDRILSNRFYRRIADTLAGTHEYMAMEKLYELVMDENHQAIVIDTPPTRSALSFLDAPNRVTDFLGGRLFRWLLWPGARAGRLTLGAARLGATAFAKTAGRLVGGAALCDVADFLAAFEGMYGGFNERAGSVLGLLRDGSCVFVVVASAVPSSLEEAGYFVERLERSDMRAGAVVVNRWLEGDAMSPAGAEAAISQLERGGPEARAAAGVLATAARRAARANAQSEALRGPAVASRDPHRAGARADGGRPRRRGPASRGGGPDASARSGRGARRPEREAGPLGDGRLGPAERWPGRRAQQHASLPTAHAAPHAELHAPVQRVRQAVGTHRAKSAHLLGSALGLSTRREEQLGIVPETPGVVFPGHLALHRRDGALQCV